jgi:hypothetical protein
VNTGAGPVPEPLSDDAAAAMVEVLQRHRVAFVVIGGFAIQLHGVDGLARTADLDVTPSRTTDNLKRLASALNELDARLRGTGLPDEGLAVPWHADLLARMELAVNLITRFGPLDISLRPSGTDGYEDLAREAVDLALGDRVAPTAALADIVRSKEAAGREKDVLALPTLERHLRARRVRGDA